MFCIIKLLFLLHFPGHLGEFLSWDSGKTLAVSTHETEVGDGKKFTQVILLVRDPYQAMSATFLKRTSTREEDYFDYEGN